MQPGHTIVGDTPEATEMQDTGSAKPAGFTPMTEEQLRASTFGELKPRNGPITLVDYDPN